MLPASRVDFDSLVLDIDYFNHRFSTPNWLIEENVNNFTDMTYVVDGKAEYFVDGKRQLVVPGDLIYIPRNTLRSAVAYQGALIESYCLNVTLTNLSGVQVELPFPLIHKIGDQPEVLALMHELKSAWLLRDTGYRLQARALAMLIVQRYIQLVVYKNDATVTDLRIKRVLQHVIDHYSEALTTQGMAEMTGLSPMYFGNLFKQETGTSFKKHLNSIRLNTAEDMLSSGEFSVHEVASACGFSDIFYFSKVFKEYHGISPSKVTRFGKGRTGIGGQKNS